MTDVDSREPAERLKEARIAAGFVSARAAAAALRVKPSTYAAHENGTRGLDLPTAIRYGKRFKKNAFWLLYGTETPQTIPTEIFDQPDEIDPDETPTIGSETGRRGIPPNGIAEIDVTGGLGAGGLTIVNSGVPGRAGMTFSAESVRDYWVFPAWLLARFDIRPDNATAFPVQGDSMEPTLRNGDVIFVDTRHRVPSPPGIYALSDEFGGVVVKRLEVISKPRDEEVIVRIMSDNPRHETRELPLSDIYIIGRYLGRFTV